MRAVTAKLSKCRDASSCREPFAAQRKHYWGRSSCRCWSLGSVVKAAC